MSLDALRSYYGKPIYVSSWDFDMKGHQYRGLRPLDCPIGAKNSKHKLGIAFDITAEDTQDLLKTILKVGRCFKIHRIEEPKVTLPKNYIHVEFGSTIIDKIYVFWP